MGCAKGKNDIAGIVKVAMFGSLYEIPKNDMEGRREENFKEEGQMSLRCFAQRQFIFVA